MPSIERVAIVGAGIAGLTAALALSQRGIACDIIEQAGRIEEIGAGLQISPNASRVLGRLGVLAPIEAVWNEPHHVALASGLSLRPLAHVPVGRSARERWGAPYGVLRRATLQRALLSAVEMQPLCRLHLGRRLEQTMPDAIAAVVGSRPELVIGADGVWSQVRAAIPASPTPRFSGHVAWRMILPADRALPALRRDAVTAFLGPGAHVVSYPLNEINGFNIVAIAAGADPGRTWQAQADARSRDQLLRRFSDWHAAVGNLLRGADDATFWPLYEVGHGRWHNGRDTVLIGDAAHAMMPFAAQGAAMAIEDAARLADHLTGPGSVAEKLAAFQAERVARTDRVRSRGAFNRFAYHARGPVRLIRDTVLSLRPPQSLAADLDWLYGYDAGRP